MVTRGEHDALIKLVRKNSPNSILEIGIGDGSRMPAILSAIAAEQTDSAIKAAVIDQFEMGDGSVPMREYHKRLSGLPLRPAIFPEPVGRGLISVANRLGQMDLVLIDEAILREEASEARTDLFATIGRIMHPNSVLITNQTGKWASFSLEQITASRSIRSAA
jgi:hypothetical protein